MKLEGFLSLACGIVALVVGFITFSVVHPEHFLHKPQTWTATQVEQMPLNCKGQLPAFDIPHIESATQFSDDVLYSTDKMTVKPISIVPTNVYELQTWTSPTTTVGHRRHRRTKQKDIVVTSTFHDETSYNRYYILELPNHSHILAKIPPHFVSAAKKGKSLPIGEKTYVPAAAKNALSKYTQQYHFPTDCVYDCFDTKWYEQNSFLVLFIKGIAGFITFCVVIFPLLKLVAKISKKPIA